MSRARRTLLAGLLEFNVPTCLILGTPEGFARMEADMRARIATFADDWSAGSEKVAVSFSKNTSAFRVFDWGADWTISDADAEQFADLIQVLVHHGGPAHQYLDPSGHSDGDWEVRASCNEYEPERFGSAW